MIEPSSSSSRPTSSTSGQSSISFMTFEEDLVQEILSICKTENDVSELQKKIFDSVNNYAAQRDNSELHPESQYGTTFQSLGDIGESKHASVKKVRNNVDGKEYALKIIPFSESRSKKADEVLREVRCLAKVDCCSDHHVVQYKSTWTEPMYRLRSCISPTPNTSKGKEEDDSGLSDSFSEESSSQESQTSGCKMCLFILMQLYESNLRTYLENRNAQTSKEDTFGVINEATSMEVFEQTVKGLEFIHSKNIIHRDLKPSNIFVGGGHDNIHCVIGDFGLGKITERLNTKCSHTIGVGTPLYTSFEQMSGKYDSKTDIFSAGLILFELLYPINSSHERQDVLTNVRSARLPKKFKENFQYQSNLILQMTQQDSTKRPTAKEILQDLQYTYKGRMKVATDADVPNMTLEEKVKKLEEENEQLKHELHKKNACLADLQTSIQSAI